MDRFPRLWGATLGAGLSLLGCGADGGDSAVSATSGTGSAGDGGMDTAVADATTGGVVGDDTTGGDAGSEGESGDDSGAPGPMDVVCDDSRAIDVPFASLPAFASVTGTVRGSGVSLAFEPVDGARDYRVYALPAADAVEAGSELHIADATYRCAGDRAASDLPYYQNGFLGVDVKISGAVGGYDRDDAESTLGHVFPVPGPDRIPVYRVGSPESDHDGQCYGGRYATSRAPRFTTDPATREAWLDAGWRDDGIVFYVAATGDRPVYFDTLSSSDAWVFYASDDEVATRGMGTREFEVLDAPTDGSVPLRRFFMEPCGSIAHDVLSAGESRFARDSQQGAQPVWRLDWPELQPDQVLVVEALDAGCPFQGHLSARSVPATANAQPFVTVDEVRAGAPFGEVFINGQHDTDSNPQPIARSFVCPTPAAPEAMDVLETFSDPMDFVEVDLQTNGGWNLYLENDAFDASFFSMEPDVYGLDSVRGELWVTYADWASDTNGRFRLTSKTPATIAADTFVHATVEVDMFSTSRRYPQLWISSAPAPVQDTMVNGVTVNLQLFAAWPTSLQLQWCDHRNWDVNDQCPIFATEHEDFSGAPWPAQPFVSDATASGVRSRLDLWASTDRAYVFLDGVPHSCVDFPGLLPAGEATVTYGDTLYHSGVDEPVVDTPFMDFLRDHQLTETRRHVDNYGFSSGLPEPEWNHTRLPCASGL